MLAKLSPLSAVVDSRVCSLLLWTRLSSRTIDSLCLSWFREAQLRHKLCLPIQHYIHSLIWSIMKPPTLEKKFNQHRSFSLLKNWTKSSFNFFFEMEKKFVDGLAKYLTEKKSSRPPLLEDIRNPLKVRET